MRSFAAVAVTLAITLAAARADAFELAHTDNGDLVRWHAAPRFHTSMKDAGPLRGAAREWSKALPKALAIKIAHDKDAHLDPRDHVNSVVWLDEGFSDEFDGLALAATVRAYRRDTGELVDADIAVNGSGYDWSIGDMTGCELAFDLQAVFTHELGHAIGLNHNEDDPTTIMYPAINACELKRDLEDDDMAGATLLYADIEVAEPGDADAPGAVGCSAANGGGAASWLGLVLLAVVLRPSRRRAAALVAGVLVWCSVGAGPADAAVVRGVAIEELSARSGVVARGRVTGQRTHIARGRVYQDTTVAVDACWQGDCPSTLVVRQLGGTVGDLTVEVEGTARLADGDEVVLFVRQRRDGAWSPTGMALGSFAIERSKQSVRAVRDARGLVLAQPDGSVVRGQVEHIDLDTLERRVNAAK